MLEELQTRAEQALELARQLGAQGAAVSTSRDRDVECVWRDGQVERLQESVSKSLSVRLFVDGRYSSHETTDLRPEQLRSFLSDAIALTRMLAPDPHRNLPDAALFQGRQELDLKLADPSLADLTNDARIQRCAEMASPILGKPKVISTSTSFSDSHNLSWLATSNGFAGGMEARAVSQYAEVTFQDEGDARPEGDFYTVGRTLGGLTPAEIGQRALAEGMGRLGAKPGPSGKRTLVVSPRAAGRLLGALLTPATAAALQQGRSFWDKRLGQPTFSPLLSVTDDPFVVGGLASRLFDGEGISAKAMPVIEKGVPKNVYVDTYYGKKLGMAPTTGGPSNRSLALGKANLDKLVSGVKDGILVRSWLGGNSDPTSGEFSLGLRGNRIEKGKIGGPVGEMNVTGNLVKLFQQLAAVGNDPWPYAALAAPTLVFEGVDFSGR